MARAAPEYGSHGAALASLLLRLVCENPADAPSACMSWFQGSFEHRRCTITMRDLVVELIVHALHRTACATTRFAEGRMIPTAARSVSCCLNQILSLCPELRHGCWLVSTQTFTCRPHSALTLTSAGWWLRCLDRVQSHLPRGQGPAAGAADPAPRPAPYQRSSAGPPLAAEGGQPGLAGQAPSHRQRRGVCSHACNTIQGVEKVQSCSFFYI